MKVTGVQYFSSPTYTPITMWLEESLRLEIPDAQWSYFDKASKRGKDFWINRNHFSLSISITIGKDSYILLFGVEPGWITDFGSVPSLARGLISHTDPRALDAYIPHDLGYACKWKSDLIKMDRKFWDDLMYAIQEYSSYNSLKRSIVYRAVRMGGLGAWKDSDVLYDRLYSKFKIKKVEP